MDRVSRTVEDRAFDLAAHVLELVALEGRDRFRLVRRSVGLAHSHAAETDGRDLEALAAEFAFAQAHCVPPPLPPRGYTVAKAADNPGLERRVGLSEVKSLSSTRTLMTGGI